MCWQRDLTRNSEASVLRREVTGHLRDHSSHDDDVDGAELIVGELLSNAIRYTPGHVCIEVDWNAHHAVLTVHDAGRGFAWAPTLPTSSCESGRGSYIVAQLALDVSVHADARGSRISVMLPIAKPARVPKPTACPFMRSPAMTEVCERPRAQVAGALAN
jgi:anti-sigma regulatory factor (Ser/Thr protein kinase)